MSNLVKMRVHLGQLQLWLLPAIRLRNWLHLVLPLPQLPLQARALLRLRVLSHPLPLPLLQKKNFCHCCPCGWTTWRQLARCISATWCDPRTWQMQPMTPRRERFCSARRTRPSCCAAPRRCSTCPAACTETACWRGSKANTGGRGMAADKPFVVFAQWESLLREKPGSVFLGEKIADLLELAAMD